ncbi:MAG: GGDEF domain-containing protein [Coriobacteriales bacterium]
MLNYDGDVVSTVFESKSFKYIVHSLGIDESDYLDALFHLAGDGALIPSEFLERASKSGNAETLLLNENGRMLHLTISPLASTSSYSVFTLVLEEADVESESGYPGRALGVLLRSFQGAALLDYGSDSVIVLKSRKGHTPKSFNGISDYIKEYSETHIHPVDRGRVISKSEQVEHFAKSAESRKVNFSVMFRQRDYSGSYVLMQLMVFIPEGAGAPEALLCLKQAESAPGISSDETLGFDEGNGVAATSRSNAVWGGQDAPVEDNFFDRALTDSLAVSLVEEDPDLSIQNFIGTLGKNLGADRTYVVEAAAAGVLNNTYEWCAPSVIPRKSELQNVDSTFFGSLYEQIKEQSPLLLKDVEPLKESSPKIFNYLLMRNVHSTAVSVLMISGKPVGFFGIENSPAIASDHDGMRLRTTAQFISIMIRNRNVMAHLDYLSLRDDLTGILNRRGLEQYIRTVPSGLRLVLVYADLNNLKEVNDTLGHDAGDELIKESGQTMLRVAGRGHVYRLGGDEFAMTFELDPDSDCLQPIRDVRKAFIDKSISVALGYSTTVTPVRSIDELLQQADRDMYVNKQQMHQARNM